MGVGPIAPRSVPAPAANKSCSPPNRTALFLLGELTRGRSSIFLLLLLAVVLPFASPSPSPNRSLLPSPTRLPPLLPSTSSSISLSPAYGLDSHLPTAIAMDNGYIDEDGEPLMDFDARNPLPELQHYDDLGDNFCDDNGGADWNRDHFPMLMHGNDGTDSSSKPQKRLLKKAGGGGGGGGMIDDGLDDWGRRLCWRMWRPT